MQYATPASGPARKLHRFVHHLPQTVWALARAFLIIGTGFVLLYPILFMGSASIKPISEVLDPSVVWIPRSVTLDNFLLAFKAMKYPAALLNTLQVGLSSAVLEVVSCALVGYGFARFKFRLRGILFALVILTILVPPQTMIIPLFLQYKYFDPLRILHLLAPIFGTPSSIRLIDTPLVFLLPSAFATGIRAGLFIFVFRQFFRGMPRELEEAAWIDGCGPFSTFVRIMAPNAKGSILTVFLFALVWHWNEYFSSVMLMSRIPTIATALAGLRISLRTVIGDQSLDPFLVSSRLQAGCLLSIAPLLLLYFLCQRFLTQSIERTGIVG
jgi:multiple sugar transport system permease protein